MPLAWASCQAARFDLRRDVSPEVGIGVLLLGGFLSSRAASHPADELVTGKAVLYPPCLELIGINRIRQVP
jgi:hypothetical protein